MKQVVVVDLDGCLSRVNTFRFWLLFSIPMLLLRLRWRELLRLLLACLQRLVGQSDRLLMKQAVMRQTQSAPDWVFQVYMAILDPMLNKQVLKLLESLRAEGKELVLNTAAPGFYARYLDQCFSFDAILASADVNSDRWFENSGEQKVMALELLYKEQYQLVCVITDHHDDLPLMQRAESVILVCPGEPTLLALADKINYKIL